MCGLVFLRSSVTVQGELNGLGQTECLAKCLARSCDMAGNMFLGHGSTLKIKKANTRHYTALFRATPPHFTAH